METQPDEHRLTHILLTFCLLGIALIGWSLRGLERGQEIQTALLERIAIATEERPMSTTWTDTSGQSHTLTTPRLPDERTEDWLARHQADLAAAQAIWPPA